MISREYAREIYESTVEYKKTPGLYGTGRSKKAEMLWETLFELFDLVEQQKKIIETIRNIILRGNDATTQE